jgi:hypothetical protein
MKKTYTTIINGAILTGALTLGSCLYDFPVQPEPTTGQADFTKIVAIGNSVTAGFMDGALYNAGQENSFPAILAQQAATLGGGPFIQPLVNSANGCFNPAGGCTEGRLILRGTTSPVPRPTEGDPRSLARFTGAPANQINNWGVPGVTLGTALSPLTGQAIPPNPAFNPFYHRIASNPGTSTLIGDAAASLVNGGTFFTFWLGNNDVLGYATGGASNPALLTSQADFQTRFNQALNAILNARADAEGAVANIPDVGRLPFFTTVPANPVPLDAGTAGMLNANFAGYNNTLVAFSNPPFNLPAAEMTARRIEFRAGAGNRVLINDETARDLGPLWDMLQGAGGITAAQRAALEPFRRARQTVVPAPAANPPVQGDLLVLPAAAFIGTTVGGNPALINGVSVPLADQWVLLPSEQNEIQEAVNGYNGIIRAAVDAQGARLVLVDVNAAFADVRAGRVSIKGSAFSSSIAPPFGAFSVDGVHPNQRAQAYIANLFIQAINGKWGARIPLTNPNDFAGNALPIP